MLGAASRREWVDQVRRAEDLGYSAVYMPDHFWDQLAPVPALAVAAEATTHVRIGTHVLGNDYRHPVVVAKEAATLDLLSDGRLELGIGAGWLRSDYAAAGLAYDPASERIRRLGETLRILKGFFAEGSFSLDGDFYTITDLEGRPKPVQRPHPPLLLGGGGRRMLELAAREADIVSINPNLRSGGLRETETGAEGRKWAVAGEARTAAATSQKVEWVRAAAGDRFDQLELSVFARVVPTGDRRAEAARMAHVLDLPAAEVLASPHVLVGTVDDIAEDVVRRRDAYGISFVVVGQASLRPMAPVVERLAGT